MSKQKIDNIKTGENYKLITTEGETFELNYEVLTIEVEKGQKIRKEGWTESDLIDLACQEPFVYTLVIGEYVYHVLGLVKGVLFRDYTKEQKPKPIVEYVFVERKNKDEGNAILKEEEEKQFL